MSILLDHMNVILYAVAGYFLLWAMGLVVIYFYGIRLSNLALELLQRDDILFSASGDTGKIRRHYKWILEIAAAFYYFFLPLPIILVCLCTAFAIALLDHFRILNTLSLGGILAIAIAVISVIIKSLIYKK